MQFGVHLGPQDLTVTEMRHAWRRIEDLGFRWISVWDHFYPASEPYDRTCFEATAAHAALAVDTTRVRVGCLVYSTGYRHPAVLANAGATIDHLSEGRLELGLGAGWHRAEYDAYGIPFESPAVRLRRLAEYVSVVRLLWTEPVVDLDGEFFTLTQARCEPKPLQHRPRIWVGARGDRALRLAGEIGDGWNAAYVSPGEFRRALEVVQSHRPSGAPIVSGVNVGLLPDSPGGETAQFLATRFGAHDEAVADGILTGSRAAIVDQVGRYQEAGADWLNVALRAPIDLGVLEWFAAEVVPDFAGDVSATRAGMQTPGAWGLGGGGAAS